MANEIQTDRQTGRQTERQADRQMDRQTDMGHLCVMSDPKEFNGTTRNI